MGRRSPAQLVAHAQESRRYRAAHREEIRAYDKAHRAERKEMFYSDSRGCVDCGSTEQLERDHIDPSTKRANVSNLLTHSIDKLRAEVDKTVLRCRPHHRKRTLFQRWGRTEPMTAVEHRAKKRVRDRARLARNRDHVNALRRAWYKTNRAHPRRLTPIHTVKITFSRAETRQLAQARTEARYRINRSVILAAAKAAYRRNRRQILARAKAAYRKEPQKFLARVRASQARRRERMAA